MKYAIAFIICLIIATILLLVGWKKRPTKKPEKITIYGKTAFGLSIGAILLAIPAVTAPLSIVLAGLGLIAGVLAFNAGDTHRLTVIGQSVLAVPVLFWIVFLIAELIFPH